MPSPWFTRLKTKWQARPITAKISEYVRRSENNLLLKVFAWQDTKSECVNKRHGMANSRNKYVLKGKHYNLGFTMLLPNLTFFKSCFWTFSCIGHPTRKVQRSTLQTAGSVMYSPEMVKSHDSNKKRRKVPRDRKKRNNDKKRHTEGANYAAGQFWTTELINFNLKFKEKQRFNFKTPFSQDDWFHETVETTKFISFWDFSTI